MKTEYKEGDCLEVMRNMEEGQFDLIATDPPFNTGKDWGQYSDEWEWTDTIDKEYYSSLSITQKAIIDVAYRVHSESMGAYCTFLMARIIEMRNMLKPTGSIYIHCDKSASAYIRIIMDEVFGKDRFRNEIVWNYRGMNGSKRKFQQKHDTIFYYVKDQKSDFYFDAPMAEPTGESKKQYESGKRIGYIVNKKRNMALVFNWEKFKTALNEGKIPSGLYAKEFTDGKPVMSDWWHDIKILGGPVNHERVGYPTQKPISLYTRIINASCPPGGYVLDPFCGSGTTLDAARSLGRNCTGIDINPAVSGIISKRLSQLCI